MKNLKLSLLAIALFTMFSMTLTSCGDKKNDPTPVVQKTDLEKAQEAVAGSVWLLQSAVVTTSTQSYNYAGDCNFAQFGSNTSLASMTTDFKYTFASDGTLSYEEQCGTQNKTGIAYTVTQSGTLFIITYKHGSQDVKFEIQNDVQHLKDSQINVKRTTPLVGGATDVKLTFVRS